MGYLRNEPQASDDLSVSQPKLLDNTNYADDYFGVDHYAFSAGSNNGLHNTVTQPLIVGGVHPNTTTYPIIYSMQDSSNLGLLQYSRGPNSAAPSPITYLQSSSTPFSLGAGQSQNILNLSGINFLMGTFSASGIRDGFNIMTQQGFYYDNTPHFAVSNSPPLSIVYSGGNLKIYNTAGNVTNIKWSIQFSRVNS